MTSLLTAQAKASAKILSFASPAIHHLVDSGFCSCITPWRRQLKTVALSQRALKSFRIANHKSLRIGKRFLAVKKDTGEKEENHNDKIYTHHWIGPPDPVSNLRYFKFVKQKNPNKYDLLLEKEREETHIWNNNFWTHHNNKFFEEKRKFSKELDAKGISDKEASDEMSQFYKYFLDRHYEMHCKYNREWYRRNFKMLLTAIFASLTRILRR